MNKKNKITGFTIVELIVVITVIGMLAGISLVVYSGMRRNAVISVITTDLRNAVPIIENHNIKNGQYPVVESSINNGTGLTKSPGTAFMYVYDSSTNSYCLSAISSQSKDVPSYMVTSQRTSPYPGICQKASPTITRTSAIGSSDILFRVYYTGVPEYISYQRSNDPSFSSTLEVPGIKVTGGAINISNSAFDGGGSPYYFRACGVDKINSTTCTTGFSNIVSTNS